MKNYFINILFIFVLNCTLNDTKKGVKNSNVVQNGINNSEEYSFEEYVNLLINKNKSKEYTDINSFPD